MSAMHDRLVLAVNYNTGVFVIWECHAPSHASHKLSLERQRRDTNILLQTSFTAEIFNNLYFSYYKIKITQADKNFKYTFFLFLKITSRDENV